jgi:hypothetical protein
VPASSPLIRHHTAPAMAPDDSRLRAVIRPKVGPGRGKERPGPVTAWRVMGLSAGLLALVFPVDHGELGYV